MSFFYFLEYYDEIDQTYNFHDSSSSSSDLYIIGLLICLFFGLLLYLSDCTFIFFGSSQSYISLSLSSLSLPSSSSSSSLSFCSSFTYCQYFITNILFFCNINTVNYKIIFRCSGSCNGKTTCNM